MCTYVCDRLYMEDISESDGAENVAFYARNSIPFVVGTTGGDREKLMQDARAGNSYAVIAPQMGKQVWHILDHSAAYSEHSQFCTAMHAREYT